MSTPETVELYRIENPNIPAQPDGIISHESLVGQWFAPDIDTALNILRLQKTTKQPGTQLVVANLPKEQLDTYHVSKHPIASTMDVENNNYIIPRDGSVSTRLVSLDETIGELTPTWRNNNEIMRRVVEKLGETSVEDKAA